METAYIPAQFEEHNRGSIGGSGRYRHTDTKAFHIVNDSKTNCSLQNNSPGCVIGTFRLPSAFNRACHSIALSLLAFLLFTAGGCSSLGGLYGTTAGEKTTPHQVDVFFTTNRDSEPDSRVFFSTDRGELSHGITQVSIPPDHQLGRQEEPSIFRFEWSYEDHKHIKVRKVITLTREDYLERLRQAVADSPDGKLMIFVHGYNVDFPEANRTVAQLANDLKFSGPVVLFSWPSQGSLTGYTIDETNAQWSQTHLIELLESLIEDVPAQNIYLVGHSMGNRIIGHAISGLAGSRVSGDLIKFREIVMIAPDIDTEVFRLDIAPRLAKTGINVTVYASSNDRALMASKVFHGYPRAGESGDGLVIVDGVETVDASDVSGSMLGHSYFAEDRRIMEDIFSLLQSGQRAENRFGLATVESSGGRYWTLKN
jgi:esterase/lipase superfamily enzyme